MRRCREGFTLVEVVMAMGLLMFAVGPIVHVLLSLQTRIAGWETAMGASGPGLPPEVQQGWTWGPTVRDLRWSWGSGLTGDTRDGAALIDGIVGVWSDGWLLVCMSPDWTDETTLGSPIIWSSRAGQEVVVRMREASGPWGPPARTLVPSDDPVTPRPSAVDATSSEGDPALGSWAAVHVPEAGVVEVQILSSGAAVQKVTQASPLLVQLSTGAGSASVSWERAMQSWIPAGGRRVDLFF